MNEPENVALNSGERSFPEMDAGNDEPATSETDNPYLTPLSDNLEVLEAEIGWHQQAAGRSIFEIGRRLIKVKNEDMTHGHWMDWLKKMNIDQTFANRSMQIAKRFLDSNYADRHNLESKPMSVLRELVSLPNSVLNETFALTEGAEEKSPMDMNSNELRDLKRQLKQQEAELRENKMLAHDANKRVNQLSSQLEDSEEGLAELAAENAELKLSKGKVKKEVVYQDRIVEKEVEPKDYSKIKSEYQRLKMLYQRAKEGAIEIESHYKDQIASLESVIKGKEAASEEVKKASEELRDLKKQLKSASEDVVAIDDLRQANELIQQSLLDIAPFIYSGAVERLDPNSFAAQHYADLANQVLDYANHLVAHIPVGRDGKSKPKPVQMAGEDIIEGEVEE